MNLSQNSQTLLFTPFPASFKAASWPTFQVSPREAAFKSLEKIHQKSKFQNYGIDS